MTKQRAVEARAEQCSKFDNTSFNGYFFTWVPYLGGEIKILTVLGTTLKYTIEEEDKCQTIAREGLLKLIIQDQRGTDGNGNRTRLNLNSCAT